jgi:Protein of unknown function (DUF3800)
MVKAFADDSGSGGDSPWYVLAGYVSSVQRWIGFDADWRAVLHSPPPIHFFKSSEAESLKGQFLGATPEERNQKIDALIEVIGRYAVRAIQVRMRQRDYNEIIKLNVPEQWDDAYFFLMPGFISAVLAIEKHLGDQQPAEFVLDSSQRLDRQARKLYSQLLTLPQYAGRVASVVFSDEKDTLPLQAADLLAWQVRRAFSVPNEPRRTHYDRAQYCAKEPPFPVILNRADLAHLLAVMEANAQEEAAKLGVPLDSLRKQLFRRRKKPKD